MVRFVTDLKQRIFKEEDSAAYSVREYNDKANPGNCKYSISKCNSWETESKMNQTDPLAVNDYWERHNSLSDVIKIEDEDFEDSSTSSQVSTDEQYIGDVYGADSQNECSDKRHTVDSNHMNISSISEESFSLGASLDNEEIDIETVSPDVLSITESLIKEKRNEVRKQIFQPLKIQKSNKVKLNQDRGKLYVIEECTRSSPNRKYSAIRKRNPLKFQQKTKSPPRRKSSSKKFHSHLNQLITCSSRSEVDRHFRNVVTEAYESSDINVDIRNVSERKRRHEMKEMFIGLKEELGFNRLEHLSKLSILQKAKEGIKQLREEELLLRNERRAQTASLISKILNLDRKYNVEVFQIQDRMHVYIAMFFSNGPLVTYIHTEFDTQNLSNFIKRCCRDDKEKIKVLGNFKRDVLARKKCCQKGEIYDSLALRVSLRSRQNQKSVLTNKIGNKDNMIGKRCNIKANSSNYQKFQPVNSLVNSGNTAEGTVICNTMKPHLKNKTESENATETCLESLENNKPAAKINNAHKPINTCIDLTNQTEKPSGQPINPGDDSQIPFVGKIDSTKGTYKTVPITKLASYPQNPLDTKIFLMCPTQNVIDKLSREVGKTQNLDTTSISLNGDSDRNSLGHRKNEDKETLKVPVASKDLVLSPSEMTENKCKDIVDKDVNYLNEDETIKKEKKTNNKNGDLTNEFEERKEIASSSNFAEGSSDNSFKMLSNPEELFPLRINEDLQHKSSSLVKVLEIKQIAKSNENMHRTEEYEKVHNAHKWNPQSNGDVHRNLEKDSFRSASREFSVGVSDTEVNRAISAETQKIENKRTMLKWPTETKEKNVPYHDTPKHVYQDTKHDVTLTLSKNIQGNSRKNIDVTEINFVPSENCQIPENKNTLIDKECVTTEISENHKYEPHTTTIENTNPVSKQPLSSNVSGAVDLCSTNTSCSTQLSEEDKSHFSYDIHSILDQIVTEVEKAETIVTKSVDIDINNSASSASLITAEMQNKLKKPLEISATNYIFSETQSSMAQRLDDGSRDCIQATDLSSKACSSTANKSSDNSFRNCNVTADLFLKKPESSQINSRKIESEIPQKKSVNTNCKSSAAVFDLSKNETPSSLKIAGTFVKTFEKCSSRLSQNSGETSLNISNTVSTSVCDIFATAWHSSLCKSSDYNSTSTSTAHLFIDDSRFYLTNIECAIQKLRTTDQKLVESPKKISLNTSLPEEQTLNSQTASFIAKTRDSGPAEEQNDANICAKRRKCSLSFDQEDPDLSDSRYYIPDIEHALKKLRTMDSQRATKVFKSIHGNMENERSFSETTQTPRTLDNQAATEAAVATSENLELAGNPVTIPKAVIELSQIDSLRSLSVVDTDIAGIAKLISELVESVRKLIEIPVVDNTLTIAAKKEDRLTENSQVSDNFSLNNNLKTDFDQDSVPKIFESVSSTVTLEEDQSSNQIFRSGCDLNKRSNDDGYLTKQRNRNDSLTEQVSRYGNLTKQGNRNYNSTEQINNGDNLTDQSNKEENSSTQSIGSFNLSEYLNVDVRLSKQINQSFSCTKHSNGADKLIEGFITGNNVLQQVDGKEKSTKQVKVNDDEIVELPREDSVFSQQYVENCNITEPSNKHDHVNEQFSGNDKLSGGSDGNYDSSRVSKNGLIEVSNAGTKFNEISLMKENMTLTSGVNNCKNDLLDVSIDSKRILKLITVDLTPRTETIFPNWKKFTEKSKNCRSACNTKSKIVETCQENLTPIVEASFMENSECFSSNESMDVKSLVQESSPFDGFNGNLEMRNDQIMPNKFQNAMADVLMQNQGAEPDSELGNDLNKSPEGDNYSAKQLCETSILSKQSAEGKCWTKQSDRKNSLVDEIFPKRIYGDENLTKVSNGNDYLTQRTYGDKRVSKKSKEDDDLNEQSKGNDNFSKKVTGNVKSVEELNLDDKLTETSIERDNQTERSAVDNSLTKRSNDFLELVDLDNRLMEKLGENDNSTEQSNVNDDYLTERVNEDDDLIERSEGLNKSTKLSNKDKDGLTVASKIAIESKTNDESVITSDISSCKNDIPAEKTDSKGILKKSPEELSLAINPPKSIETVSSNREKIIGNFSKCENVSNLAARIEDTSKEKLNSVSLTSIEKSKTPNFASTPTVVIRKIYPIRKKRIRLKYNESIYDSISRIKKTPTEVCSPVTPEFIDEKKVQNINVAKTGKNGDEEILLVTNESMNDSYKNQTEKPSQFSDELQTKSISNIPYQGFKVMKAVVGKPWANHTDLKLINSSTQLFTRLKPITVAGNKKSQYVYKISKPVLRFPHIRPSVVSATQIPTTLVNPARTWLLMSQLGKKSNAPESSGLTRTGTQLNTYQIINSFPIVSSSMKSNLHLATAANSRTIINPNTFHHKQRPSKLYKGKIAIGVSCQSIDHGPNSLPSTFTTIPASNSKPFFVVPVCVSTCTPITREVNNQSVTVSDNMPIMSTSASILLKEKRHLKAVSPAGSFSETKSISKISALTKIEAPISCRTLDGIITQNSLKKPIVSTPSILLITQVPSCSGKLYKVPTSIFRTSVVTPHTTNITNTLVQNETTSTFTTPYKSSLLMKPLTLPLNVESIKFDLKQQTTMPVPCNIGSNRGSQESSSRIPANQNKNPLNSAKTIKGSKCQQIFKNDINFSNIVIPVSSGCVRNVFATCRNNSIANKDISYRNLVEKCVSIYKTQKNKERNDTVSQEILQTCSRGPSENEGVTSSEMVTNTNNDIDGGNFLEKNIDKEKSESMKMKNQENKKLNKEKCKNDGKILQIDVNNNEEKQTNLKIQGISKNLDEKLPKKLVHKMPSAMYQTVEYMSIQNKSQVIENVTELHRTTKIETNISKPCKSAFLPIVYQGNSFKHNGVNIHEEKINLKTNLNVVKENHYAADSNADRLKRNHGIADETTIHDFVSGEKVELASNNDEKCEGVLSVMGSNDAKESRVSVGPEVPSNCINMSETSSSIVSNSDSKQHPRERIFMKSNYEIDETNTANTEGINVENNIAMTKKINFTSVKETEHQTLTKDKNIFGKIVESSTVYSGPVSYDKQNSNVLENSFSGNSGYEFHKCKVSIQEEVDRNERQIRQPNTSDDQWRTQTTTRCSPHTLSINSTKHSTDSTDKYNYKINILTIRKGKVIISLPAIYKSQINQVPPLQTLASFQSCKGNQHARSMALSYSTSPIANNDDKISKYVKENITLIEKIRDTFLTEKFSKIFCSCDRNLQESVKELLLSLVNKVEFYMNNENIENIDQVILQEKVTFKDTSLSFMDEAETKLEKKRDMSKKQSICDVLSPHTRGWIDLTPEEKQRILQAKDELNKDHSMLKAVTLCPKHQAYSHILETFHLLDKVSTIARYGPCVSMSTRGDETIVLSIIFCECHQFDKKVSIQTLLDIDDVLKCNGCRNTRYLSFDIELFNRLICKLRYTKSLQLNKIVSKHALSHVKRNSENKSFPIQDAESPLIRNPDLNQSSSQNTILNSSCFNEISGIQRPSMSEAEIVNTYHWNKLAATENFEAVNTFTSTFSYNENIRFQSNNNRSIGGNTCVVSSIVDVVCSTLENGVKNAKKGNQQGLNEIIPALKDVNAIKNKDICRDEPSKSNNTIRENSNDNAAKRSHQFHDKENFPSIETLNSVDPQIGAASLAGSINHSVITKNHAGNIVTSSTVFSENDDHEASDNLREVLLKNQVNAPNVFSNVSGALSTCPFDVSTSEQGSPCIVSKTGICSSKTEVIDKRKSNTFQALHRVVDRLQANLGLQIGNVGTEDCSATSLISGKVSTSYLSGDSYGKDIKDLVGSLLDGVEILCDTLRKGKSDLEDIAFGSALPENQRQSNPSTSSRNDIRIFEHIIEKTSDRKADTERVHGANSTDKKASVVEEKRGQSFRNKGNYREFVKFTEPSERQEKIFQGKSNFSTHNKDLLSKSQCSTNIQGKITISEDWSCGRNIFKKLKSQTKAANTKKQKLFSLNTSNKTSIFQHETTNKTKDTKSTKKNQKIKNNKKKGKQYQKQRPLSNSSEKTNKTKQTDSQELSLEAIKILFSMPHPPNFYVENTSTTNVEPEEQFISEEDFNIDSFDIGEDLDIMTVDICTGNVNHESEAPENEAKFDENGSIGLSQAADLTGQNEKFKELITENLSGKQAKTNRIIRNCESQAVNHQKMDLTEKNREGSYLEVFENETYKGSGKIIHHDTNEYVVNYHSTNLENSLKPQESEKTKESAWENRLCEHPKTKRIEANREHPTNDHPKQGLMEIIDQNAILEISDGESCNNGKDNHSYTKENVNLGISVNKIKLTELECPSTMDKSGSCKKSEQGIYLWRNRKTHNTEKNCKQSSVDFSKQDLNKVILKISRVITSVQNTTNSLSRNLGNISGNMETETLEKDPVRENLPSNTEEICAMNFQQPKVSRTNPPKESNSESHFGKNILNVTLPISETAKGNDVTAMNKMTQNSFKLSQPIVMNVSHNLSSTAVNFDNTNPTLVAINHQLKHQQEVLKLTQERADSVASNTLKEKKETKKKNEHNETCVKSNALSNVLSKIQLSNTRSRLPVNLGTQIPVAFNNSGVKKIHEKYKITASSIEVTDFSKKFTSMDNEKVYKKSEQSMTGNVMDEVLQNMNSSWGCDSDFADDLSNTTSDCNYGLRKRPEKTVKTKPNEKSDRVPLLEIIKMTKSLTQEPYIELNKRYSLNHDIDSNYLNETSISSMLNSLEGVQPLNISDLLLYQYREKNHQFYLPALRPVKVFRKPSEIKNQKQKVLKFCDALHEDMLSYSELNCSEKKDKLAALKRLSKEEAAIGDLLSSNSHLGNYPNIFELASQESFTLNTGETSNRCGTSEHRILGGECCAICQGDHHEIECTLITSEEDPDLQIKKEDLAMQVANECPNRSREVEETELLLMGKSCFERIFPESGTSSSVTSLNCADSSESSTKVSRNINEIRRIVSHSSSHNKILNDEIKQENYINPAKNLCLSSAVHIANDVTVREYSKSRLRSKQIGSTILISDSESDTLRENSDTMGKSLDRITVAKGNEEISKDKLTLTGSPSKQLPESSSTSVIPKSTASFFRITTSGEKSFTVSHISASSNLSFNNKKSVFPVKHSPNISITSQLSSLELSTPKKASSAASLPSESSNCNLSRDTNLHQRISRNISPHKSSHRRSPYRTSYVSSRHRSPNGSHSSSCSVSPSKSTKFRRERSFEKDPIHPICNPRLKKRCCQRKCRHRIACHHKIPDNLPSRSVSPRKRTEFTNERFSEQEKKARVDFSKAPSDDLNDSRESKFSNLKQDEVSNKTSFSNKNFSDSLHSELSTFGKSVTSLKSASSSKSVSHKQSASSETCQPVEETTQLHKTVDSDTTDLGCKREDGEGNTKRKVKKIVIRKVKRVVVRKVKKSFTKGDKTIDSESPQNKSITAGNSSQNKATISSVTPPKALQISGAKEKLEALRKEIHKSNSKKVEHTASKEDLKVSGQSKSKNLDFLPLEVSRASGPEMSVSDSGETESEIETNQNKVSENTVEMIKLCRNSCNSKTAVEKNVTELPNSKNTSRERQNATEHVNLSSQSSLSRCKSNNNRNNNPLDFENTTNSPTPIWSSDQVSHENPHYTVPGQNICQTVLNTWPCKASRRSSNIHYSTSKPSKAPSFAVYGNSQNIFDTEGSLFFNSMYGKPFPDSGVISPKVFDYTQYEPPLKQMRLANNHENMMNSIDNALNHSNQFANDPPFQGNGNGLYTDFSTEAEVFNFSSNGFGGNLNYSNKRLTNDSDMVFNQDGRIRISAKKKNAEVKHQGLENESGKSGIVSRLGVPSYLNNKSTSDQFQPSFKQKGAANTIYKENIFDHQMNNNNKPQTEQNDKRNAVLALRNRLKRMRNKECAKLRLISKAVKKRKMKLSSAIEHENSTGVLEGGRTASRNERKEFNDNGECDLRKLINKRKNVEISRDQSLQNRRVILSGENVQLKPTIQNQHKKSADVKDKHKFTRKVKINRNDLKITKEHHETSSQYEQLGISKNESENQKKYVDHPKSQENSRTKLDVYETCTSFKVVTREELLKRSKSIDTDRRKTTSKATVLKENLSTDILEKKSNASHGTNSNRTNPLTHSNERNRDIKYRGTRVNVNNKKSLKDFIVQDFY